MELNEKIMLLYKIREDLGMDILKNIDEFKELNGYEDIIEATNIIKESTGEPSCFRNILKVLINLDNLEMYDNILKHPIYINLFRDKNGNQYLQARASIKVNSKVVWVNAYVGKLSEFHKGVNDPNAISKGKKLVRKKLLEKHRELFRPV